MPVVLFQAKISLYDLFIAGIALLLTEFFVNTAFQEARKLAMVGE
jgi:hypothetical protein